MAILGAGQPDPQFLPALHADLHASGMAQKVSISLIADLGSMTGRAGLHDLTLLMGLDHGHSSLQALHNAIRQKLVQFGSDYQVLYCTPEEKIDLVLRLIEHQLQPVGTNRAVRDGSSRPWVWVCDKCSDPACEQQLLSGLLA